MDFDKSNEPVLEEPELPIAKDIKEFNLEMMNKFNFYKLLLFKYTSKSIPYRELSNWM